MFLFPIQNGSIKQVESTDSVSKLHLHPKSTIYCYDLNKLFYSLCVSFLVSKMVIKVLSQRGVRIKLFISHEV